MHTADTQIAHPTALLTALFLLPSPPPPQLTLELKYVSQEYQMVIPSYFSLILRAFSTIEGIALKVRLFLSVVIVARALLYGCVAAAVAVHVVVSVARLRVSCLAGIAASAACCFCC